MCCEQHGWVEAAGSEVQVGRKSGEGVEGNPTTEYEGWEGWWIVERWD